jgi:hypothetical protein
LCASQPVTTQKCVRVPGGMTPNVFSSSACGCACSNAGSGSVAGTCDESAGATDVAAKATVTREDGDFVGIVDQIRVYCNLEKRLLLR